MAKKNRSGNREPRKPKKPKSESSASLALSKLMPSRAGLPTGAK